MTDEQADNEREAELRAKADAGDVDAMGHLGALLFELGRREEAMSALKSAADQGSGVALYNLSSIESRGGDKEAMYHLLERAAQVGHALAQFRLGLHLIESSRGPESRPTADLRGHRPGQRSGDSVDGVAG
jgi:TPR repeat protein